MRKTTATAALLAGTLLLGACDSDQAEITTTTLDASLLTTTTTSPSDAPETTEAPGTTRPPADEVESWEVITRTSDEEGETIYVLVSPGNYSDVSMENFLGDLLEDETALSGVEVFDDRAALDAALKAEDERSEEEVELIQQHHLVSLREGRQVDFQGPLSDYEDFVIGS